MKATRQDIDNATLDLLRPLNGDDAETRRKKLQSRNDLKRALREALRGERVNVAFYYQKEAAPGRVAMEDYLPLPGIPDDFHMGQIVAVLVSKKGNLYFRMRDFARSDGDNVWSWTSVRVDRIREFQYRGSRDAARWNGKRSA